MGLRKGVTTKLEEVSDVDKSGESTESLETTEMSDASRDSFDEYKEMVDEFNGRIDSDSILQHYAGAPSDNNNATADGCIHPSEARSGAPDDTARYSAEIWYPESRDCTCCQGFKYGCICVANHGICRCCTGGLDNIPVATMNPYDVWYQNLQCKPIEVRPAEVQFQPQERQHSRRNLCENVNSREKINSSCRFFFSSTGCRYGDACSFSHTTSEGVTIN